MSQPRVFFANPLDRFFFSQQTWGGCRLLEVNVFFSATSYGGCESMEVGKM